MTLRPIPFAVLLRRVVHELENRHDDGAVLELPVRKLWLGAPGLDLSVRHHGRTAATPLGPAAGPHTQLAPNIIVGWLAGCRVIELKTVQVRDDLVIPRPCIDMATVGFNVEWSQELRLEQSAAEYVKASMVIDMLRQGGLLPLPRGTDATVFDTSVGYDLSGIRSARLVRFLDTLRDAGTLIDRLRSKIPAELERLRDIAFTREISGSATLSTFHGCPPGEIEAIACWLMEERGLDVTVKLNPTLLGQGRVREVLHDLLGYREIQVPASAFDNDPSWEDTLAIIGRLREKARVLGRGLGIKLTNTLVVENHRSFFPPTEQLMYLSGAPLHVLASELVMRFRDTFGAELPISFSAGVDRHNFADAVASGLVPVTACSDLLQPGGYARAHGCLAELATRMQAAKASDIPGFIRASRGGDPVANARVHAQEALADPHYHFTKNARPPRKLDRTLATFDCTSCDKCIPVCPNMAIFSLSIELDGRATHQIGILADACNDCGNCDVFCPEHGAPNLTKPRFHLSCEGYLAEAPRDGLFIARTPAGLTALGRFGGQTALTPIAGEAGSKTGAEVQALARGALKSGSWMAAMYPEPTS